MYISGVRVIVGVDVTVTGMVVSGDVHVPATTVSVIFLVPAVGHDI